MASIDLMGLFVLFGGTFALILATGQLTLKNRRQSNYILAALFSCIGLSQIADSFSYLGISTGLYFKFHLVSIALFYLMGPLLNFYFKSITGASIRLDRRKLIHLFPSVAAFMLFIPSFAGLSDFSTDFYLLRTSPASGFETIVYLVTYGSNIALLPYVFFSLGELFAVRSTLPRAKKGIVYPCILLAVLIILMSLSWLFDKLAALHIEIYINMAISLFIVSIYIAANRYPEYLQILKLESLKNGYTRSSITRLDLDMVLNRLRELMESERVYCEEDLSLKGLAERLGITPYQLSELLNEKLNKSFYAFVNEYRVEEARSLLLNEPDRTIISIAYAVGFNNQSAFYSVFRKHTGTTPGSLRRRSFR
jgi:AraC-like DNA-binding protein